MENWLPGGAMFSQAWSNGEATILSMLTPAGMVIWTVAARVMVPQKLETVQ